MTLEQLAFEAMPYWLLIYAIENGNGYSWRDATGNKVSYEPKDFSYWGC